MSDQKCVCSRTPKDHAATVDLKVYGWDGEIVDQLTMPTCDAVVASYRAAIAAGIMTARIEVAPL